MSSSPHRRAPRLHDHSRSPNERRSGSTYNRSSYHGRDRRLHNRKTPYDQRRPQSQAMNVGHHRGWPNYDDRSPNHHHERHGPGNSNRIYPDSWHSHSYGDPDYHPGGDESASKRLNYDDERQSPLAPGSTRAARDTQVPNSRPQAPALPHLPQATEATPPLNSVPLLEQTSCLKDEEPISRSAEAAVHSDGQISTFSGQGVWNHHRPYNKVGPQCQKQRDKLVEELSKSTEEAEYIMTDSIVAVDIQPKDLPSDPRDLANGMLEQVVALWTLAEGDRDLVFEYQRKAVMERQGRREKCYVGTEDLSRAQILLARFQGSEEATKLFEIVESEGSVSRETASSSTPTGIGIIEEAKPDAVPLQQSASVNDQEGGEGATGGERRFVWISTQSSSGPHQTQEQNEGSMSPIRLSDRMSRPYGGAPAPALSRITLQDTGFVQQPNGTQEIALRHGAGHEQSHQASTPDNIEHESTQPSGNGCHQDQPAAIPTNMAAFLQNHDQPPTFSVSPPQRPLQGTEFSYIEVSTNICTTYTSSEGATVRQETQRREKHSIRSNN